jgi:hypothetical protein
MTTPETLKVSDSTLAGDVLHAVRYYFGSRRGLFALAAIALVAGLAFNWSWLVAAGIAPLLIAVLPCVAMCALGLCMSQMTGRACSTDAMGQKATGRADADEPNDGDQQQSSTGGSPALEK